MSAERRTPLFGVGWRLHPATLILMWGAVLIGVQSLRPPLLYVSVAVMLVSGFVLSRMALWLLLRRSRWLLLSIVILFGWMTPGLPIEAIPGLTDAGLSLALLHTTRLLGALAWVAILLDHLDFPMLLSGFHRLMSPLARCGMDVDRGVMRLALTMEKLKAKEPWNINFLNQNGRLDHEAAMGTPIRLESHPYKRIDVIVTGTLVLLLAGMVLS